MGRHSVQPKRICLCTEGCSFLRFLFYNVLVLNLESQGSSINQHSWRQAKHTKWPWNICLFTQLKLKINWCAPWRILNILNIRWLLIRNHHTGHTKSGQEVCRKKGFLSFLFWCIAIMLVTKYVCVCLCLFVCVCTCGCVSVCVCGCGGSMNHVAFIYVCAECSAAAAAQSGSTAVTAGSFAARLSTGLLQLRG